MHRPTKTTVQAGSVADYLADREGLQGTSRAIFRQLLRDVFGYRASPQRRSPWCLAAIVLGLGLGGLATEWQRPSDSHAIWLWLVIVTIGAALAIAVARNQNRPAACNHDQEWRVYCLLIRPVILRSRPGLLDRNLEIDFRTEDRIATRYVGTVRVIFRERRLEFWLPAGIGWAIGGLAALVGRVAGGGAAWLILLPVAGAVLGPTGWSLFRLFIFHRLQRAAESESGDHPVG